MPRSPSRIPLENGLKLDLNDLVRRGLIRPGAFSTNTIRWTDDYGQVFTSGLITADATGPDDWFPNEAWCHLEIGNLHQRIILKCQPRHFGGVQWYFVCPFTRRKVSVLWKPTHERQFACRQYWGKLYRSQCLGWIQRCHLGKARINKRLCEIGGFDPAEWDLAPKPKWMRWRTYERAEKQFDRYQARLNLGPAGRAARFRTG
jgi:hypothetical protein